MAKLIMKVEGMDGVVELLADRVVILRPGLWNAIWYGFNSKREIPLGAISEVAFRKAGALRFGEVEFVRSGRSTDETKKRNQNAVRFNRKQNDSFEVLKEKVFELVEQYARQKQ